jgi:hypothetical protein
MAVEREVAPRLQFWAAWQGGKTDEASAQGAGGRGACWTASLTGHSQQLSTVGDVLDRGGKKLTKEEVQKLYTGATVSGVQAGKPEVTFQNKHMPDGSVTGNGWRSGVFTGTFSGTWYMNDNGQFCYNLVNGTIHNCFYYFQLSNRYYAALTDARSAPVYERQFAR